MIAAMKRILSLLFFTLMLFSVSLPIGGQTVSAAEGRYAVVPDGDVWFCAGESESSRIFLLPRSYYVRILNEGPLYCRVEYLEDEGPYKKITGYCKTEDIIAVDYIPVRPYLKKEITLSYSLPAAGSGGLGGSFSSVEKTFVYYGQRYEGAKLYYYVLADGTFDFIAADAELAYEENTDYLDYLAAQDTAAQGGEVAKPEAGGMNAAMIVVVCIACVAAVAVAVFVIRGKKPAPPDDQTED